jgi:hypothetical protein
MKPWFKLVLVWLLALALPLQALAAATMLHCGPSHGRMQAQAGARHAHHAQASAHGHGATGHPGSAYSADSADPAKAAGANDTNGTSATDNPAGFADLGQFKCSACGACCFAAAMPAFVLTVPKATAVAHWGLAPSQGRVAYLTSGPERPPKLPVA